MNIPQRRERFAATRTLIAFGLIAAALISVPVRITAGDLVFNGASILALIAVIGGCLLLVRRNKAELVGIE